MNNKELSLSEFSDLIKKNRKLIFISALLGLIIAGVITFIVIKPKYSSSVDLIVQVKENDVTNIESDINGSLLLGETYEDFILSRVIMKKVSSNIKKKYKYKITPKELMKIVEVTQSKSSLLLQINVIYYDNIEAANIANEISIVFKELCPSLINKVDKVIICQKGEVNDTSDSPNNTLNLFFGLFVGGIIGIIIAFKKNKYVNV